MSFLIETCKKWLNATEVGEAARIFHGRGRCYQGLEQINIEILGNILSLIVYKPIESETTIIEQMKGFVDANDRLSSFVVQRRYIMESPWQWVIGEPQSDLWIKENNLSYLLTFDRQNQGLFLDMKNGRQWVLDHSKGSRVLNLFSYTCGFAVSAQAGGALETVNFDISKAALSRGKRNLAENPGNTKHRFFSHNIMKSLGKIDNLGPFDLVIIDPPSRQPKSFNPKKDYPKILRRSQEFLSESAQLLVVDNDPDVSVQDLQLMVQQNAPWLKFEEHLALPEVIQEKNSNMGLKTLVYVHDLMPKPNT